MFTAYLSENGIMLGYKRFDINKNNSIMIDNVKHIDTSGLYEFIFKRFSYKAVFIKDDKQMYKNILLTTNAHRRSDSARQPIMGNKGYKYK